MMPSPIFITIVTLDSFLCLMLVLPASVVLHIPLSPWTPMRCLWLRSYLHLAWALVFLMPVQGSHDQAGVVCWVWLEACRWAMMNYMTMTWLFVRDFVDGDMIWCPSSGIYLRLWAIWICLYMKKLFLNDGNSIGQTDSAYQMPWREVVPVDLQMLTYTQVLRKLYADTLAVVHSKPKIRELAKIYGIYTINQQRQGEGV